MMEMVLFINRGWSVIEDASFGDGKPAGDGHSIDGATYSYLSCCNPDTGDFSTVISNTTQSPIEYEICLMQQNQKSVFAYQLIRMPLTNFLFLQKTI